MRLIISAVVIIIAIATKFVFAGDVGEADLQTPKGNIGLDSLATLTHSGEPTLAYFYYSVACSCQAAQCALASEVIDSIPGLASNEGDLHYLAIDAYNEDAAESLYNIESVPAIIGFDKDGKEAGRLEWFIDTSMLEKLVFRTKLINDK